MLGEQNTPPQKSEAGSLTNMYGGSCIGTSNERDSIASKQGKTKVPMNSLSSPARRSSTLFREGYPPTWHAIKAPSFTHILDRLTVTQRKSLACASTHVLTLVAISGGERMVSELPAGDCHDVGP